MRFSEFKGNVEQWATDREIYKYSTVLAQLFKTLSEFGELADGVIKDNEKDVKDAIGDTAVCLVNYAKMANYTLSYPIVMPLSEPLNVLVGKFCVLFGKTLIHEEPKLLADMFNLLGQITHLLNLDFMECCELSWKEIEHRKGRMVEGGAFVKDEAKPLVSEEKTLSDTVEYAAKHLPVGCTVQINIEKYGWWVSGFSDNGNAVEFESEGLVGDVSTATDKLLELYAEL